MNENNDEIMQAKALKIIMENIYSKNIYLDLCSLNLKYLPEELYQADHVECLYLSDNCIQQLPNMFYQNMPRLRLLDLRFNGLNQLSDRVQHLINLEILLLDGNELQILPRELGLLVKLRGLGLGSNPISSPQPHIINKGLPVLLKELNKCYFNEASNEDIDEVLSTTDNSDNPPINQDFDSSLNNRYSDKYYKPQIYHDIHQSFLEHRRRSSVPRKKAVTQTEKHNNLVNLFPEPVSIDNIEARMIDQMRLAKIKEVKQKQEIHLQKFKDRTAVNDWRSEAQDLQSYKRMEQSTKLPLEIKIESDNRLLEAPFKLEKEHLEMVSGQDLSIQKEKNLPKPHKPAPIDKETQLMIQAEQRARQKTITSKIKQQTALLSIKHTIPKGTAKEELESAKRDLEIVMQLQKELHSNLSVT